MKKMLFLALAILGAATGGCVVARHGNHHHVYGPAVAIETGHVHSEYCGHYHYHGSWYYTNGHRHGPGCGHAWQGGMWIVVD